MEKNLISQQENFVILGPPGSGKSTQATFLKQKHQLMHIDIGSELRRLAESDTELGRTINEIINVRKELVPDGLVGEVIAHVLKGIGDVQGVLVDGAPRRVSQIDEVEDALATQKRTIQKVIYLDLDQETAIRRISTRWLCQNCKAAYIGTQTEIKELGACTVCGGHIGRRPDDTEEGVAERYRIFMESTYLVIEHYRALGKLVHVDASLVPEAVSHQIEEALTL